MSTTTVDKPEQDAATEDFLDRPEYAQVTRDVRPCLPRYRNELGKFRVHRASTCKQCGRCVEVCRYGVHTRPDGYRLIIRPLDYRCIGPDCEKSDACCLQTCPQNALSLTTNPAFETLGDCRWTPELITSTWQMAETGHAAELGPGMRDRGQRRRLRSDAPEISRRLLPPVCAARISAPKCSSTGATIHASG